MARRRQQSKREREAEIYQQNEYAVWRAQQELVKSPLYELASKIEIEFAHSTDPNPPELGCVDPEAGRIILNLRQPRQRSDWVAIIAHLLLHLGLNHAARREERDLLLWNVACEETVERFLAFFRIPGAPPLEQAFAEDTEEQIYERLLRERELGRTQGYRHHYRTLAGPHRPDIMGLGRFQRWRADYEEQLALGIQLAVERTVAETAQTLGNEAVRNEWGPAARARRWVMNEFPLLGAVAPQVQIVADEKLCDRMDISVAAVNGFLGEMYFNPARQLSQDEWTFIYVHELLHVALLHHSRLRGRDPEIWNIACDFVINDWLIEMGVGQLPSVGALYDPQLKGKSADEVYDLLVCNLRECKKLRGFRGSKGDIVWERGGRPIFRGDVTTLDDVYRRCLSAGFSAMYGRGKLPAGLLEDIRVLFSPPPSWDVELGRWMECHIPYVRESIRSYARASRRQASTPDIPRPARYVPHEWIEACTFGVVLDTSGSMDRELLGRALGSIASFCEARDVPRVRLVLCDAAPYDKGWVAPTELRGTYSVTGRGGTVLQPAVNHLISRPDFPRTAPVMIITDGWCEETITCPREHCFVLPRNSRTGRMPLRPSAPVFQVLREEFYS